VIKRLLDWLCEALIVAEHARYRVFIRSKK